MTQMRMLSPPSGERKQASIVRTEKMMRRTIQPAAPAAAITSTCSRMSVLCADGRSLIRRQRHAAQLGRVVHAFRERLVRWHVGNLRQRWRRLRRLHARATGLVLNSLPRRSPHNSVCASRVHTAFWGEQMAATDLHPDVARARLAARHSQQPRAVCHSQQPLDVVSWPYTPQQGDRYSWRPRVLMPARFLFSLHVLRRVIQTPSPIRFLARREEKMSLCRVATASHPRRSRYKISSRRARHKNPRVVSLMEADHARRQ